MEPDVLRRVALLVDQSTRVACCMASRRVHAELLRPGAWPSVAVYACTPEALAFLEKVECTDLIVSCREMRAVATFLESVTAPLRKLSVVVRGQRAVFPRAWTLGSVVAKFPNLEELAVRCGAVPRASGLVFPHSMPRLRSLCITEDASPARLEVYIRDAGMLALEDVCMRVSTSDVLACIPSLPRLRFVRYHADDETYEDACFEGSWLSGMDLHVSSDVEWTYLASALDRAHSIQRLTLTSSVDLEFHKPLRVRDLVIRASRNDMTVELTLAASRVLASLAIVDAGGDGWAVRFVECGSWDKFLLFTKNTDMYIGRWGTNVTVEF